MSKAAVIKITDTLGADAICKRLGVSKHSVRYARTEGVFPASWFDPIDQMCREAEVECPRAAFNWKVSAA